MRVLPILSILTSLTSLTFASPVFASAVVVNDYSSSLDFAQVTDVLATKKSDGSWCFGTTVEHNDQGWNHYADGWAVLDLEGNQLGYRKLHHPHDNEQPFTRSLCHINIPKEMTQVIVRAKCNKHGFGGKPMVVALSKQGD